MMVRLLGTRIIVPKGDTGSFMLKRKETNAEIVKFFVQDPLTRNYIIEKECSLAGDYAVIELKSEDTKNLDAGEYFWDIKSYYSPIYDEDGILIDAVEINSYYSAFKHPLFIVKEVINNV